MQPVTTEHDQYRDQSFEARIAKIQQCGAIVLFCPVEFFQKPLGSFQKAFKTVQNCVLYLYCGNTAVSDYCAVLSFEFSKKPLCLFQKAFKTGNHVPCACSAAIL